MCSGVEPTEALSGAPYVQAALRESLGAAGPIFVTVAMLLFAFTTLLGNLYYVNQTFSHLMGKVPGRRFMTVYYLIASGVIFLGAGLNADLLWGVADITMGLMALINMPVIFLLGKYAYRALADYQKQKNEGKEPIFRAKDIGITDKLDYWN
jgi:AGCS family alanine or glycine:cation symporter